MKKLISLLSLVLLLTSCTLPQEENQYESTSFVISDYNVFFLHSNCEIIVKYIIDEIEPYVFYTDIAGCEVNVGTDTIYLLIEEEYISLKDAYDTGLIGYTDIITGIPVKREYKGDLVTCEACKEVEYGSDTVGYLNGYEMIKILGTCPMLVRKEIIVDGYNFGYFEGGCSDDINILSFYGKKDDVSYELSELLETGEITAKELYNFYICYGNGGYALSETE